MIYLDPFYAKPLAYHAIIDEDSSQAPIKLFCPPFSSFFTQSHDLIGHWCFLRRNSVSPTYLQISSTFLFSNGSVWHFWFFRMQTQKHGFVTWYVYAAWWNMSFCDQDRITTGAIYKNILEGKVPLPARFESAL